MNTVTTTSDLNNGTASNQVMYYYICGVPSRMLEQINIYFVLMCFVKPALSILGITANIISLQILRLSGLHKPSNILLFSLVIADTLCLGRSINYGSILFWFGPDDVMCGFHYSEGINYFLLYSMIGMQYFHLWGEMSNTMFPVLITFERLVAVFRPLTFARIINRRRTIVLVVCAYLIWLPWTLFLPTLYEVGFSRISKNVTYMRPALSELFYNNILILNMYDTNVNQTFSNTLPLILVTFGNIVLGIKVSVALKKRRSLTSSQKMSWSPRTTRTLKFNCFFFVIATATGTIMTQMDNNVIEDVASYYVRREVRILLLQINSSSSLFIYIASNRRFFDIFCSMFGIAMKLIKPQEDGI